VSSFEFAGSIALAHRSDAELGMEGSMVGAIAL
jgi:hypothetical protein